MQITSHVHALKIPFHVTTPAGITLERFVYVCLIYAKTVTLIDTGVSGSEEVIFRYIRSTGRDPAEIGTIVLTHSHPDHIGAASAIQRTTGCRIAAHPAERQWIEDTELQARERPVPGFSALVGGPVPVDLLLNDGDVFKADEALMLEVIHTPGHSAGSISLLLREEMVLISGDAIPVPGDIPIYDDPFISAQSIRKLRDRSGILHLLSSWNMPCRGAEVYDSMDAGLRYLARIQGAVEKVAGALASPIRPEDLAPGVLSELGIPPAAANPLAARSVMAHLKKT